MTRTVPTGKRIERTAHLRWVPIPRMKVAPGLTQRIKLRQSRVDQIVAHFDPEALGNPIVNNRDDWYYILDGWHRVEGCKGAGWGDQQLQCWTYENLTDEECAEIFLKMNDVLPVDAWSKFQTAVTAGRAVECDIDRIVRFQGLTVSREGIPGAVRAIAALRNVYARGDSTLSRTLRIVRDSYGDAGLEGGVIDGLGLLCQRYNGALDDEVAVKKLAGANGGVNGLLNKADLLRRQTGGAKAHCVAAAAVEIINAGRGGKKLPDWWKS